MSCHCTPNQAIQCSVFQCKHHCDDANYCSLEKIQVGTHESDPTVKQCTDCMSFDRIKVGGAFFAFKGVFAL